MEHVHITTGTPAQAEAIKMAVTPLLEVVDQLHAFEWESADIARRRFSLAETDGRIVSWLPLSTDAFVTRLLKLAHAKQPTAKLRDEMSAFQKTQRQRQVELLTRQLELEKKLAGLVEDAYGLTPEERALLRSTRPVRDPLDVLEAKIRGGREPDVDSADE